MIIFRRGPLARPQSVRKWMIVGIAALLTSLALCAFGTFAQGRVLDSIKKESRTVLRPAQLAAEDLQAAYVDQETGQRGYLLTGQRLYLTPYEDGGRAITADQATLTRLDIDDAAAQREVAAVVAAGKAWQTEIGEPQIALRARGPIPQDEIDALTHAGEVKFDDLRRTLTALSSRITELVSAQQKRYDSAQIRAEAATITALVAAVLTAAISLWSLQRLLSRPLSRLVRNVQRIADGNYDQPIDSSGPQEIALIADAVETMRASITEHSADLVQARHALTLSDERARIASDLHSLTIRQIYALGLELQSLGGRHVDLRDDLNGLVSDTDKIIGSLRELVFGLAADQSSGVTVEST